MAPYLLTKQEKDELRRKYLANVELINRYLPDRLKINANLKQFNARINDVAEQRFYKKGSEIARSIANKSAKVSAITRTLEDQRIKGKVYGLERGIYTKIVDSDDPAAAQYNRDVVKNYIEHPEATVQKRFQHLMNFNPGDMAKFYKSPDLKNYLLDYYEQNSEILDDGFQAYKTLGDYKKQLNPSMKKYLDAVGPNFELMSIATESIKLVANDGYFTYPELSDEAIGALAASDFTSDYQETFASIQRMRTSKDMFQRSKEVFTQQIDKMKENDMKIDEPGSLSKYVGFIDKGDKTNIMVSPIANFGGSLFSTGKNFRLAAINKNEVDGIKQVLDKDYISEENYQEVKKPASLLEPSYVRSRKQIVYDFALATNGKISELDCGNLGDIPASIHGSWKERILRTTSRQYNDLIKAMKNYDKPNSANYHDEGNVYRKANAYLIHKGVTSIEQCATLPPPADKRTMLCFNVMSTLAKNMDPSIERVHPGTNNVIRDNNVINNNDNNIIQKEPIVVPEAAEENNKLKATEELENGSNLKIDVDYEKNNNNIEDKPDDLEP